MILICGIPSEPSIALIAAQLETMQANYLLWDQNEFDNTNISFFLTGTGHIKGALQYCNKEYSLEDIKIVYSRLADWSTLPGIVNNTDVGLREECGRVHLLMQLFIDNCQGTVVNRPENIAAFNSQPYQMLLAKEAGLNIPDTCITTSEDIELDFYEEKQKQVTSKLISQSTSHAQRLKEPHIEDPMKWFSCPKQFQEVQEGNSLRVHIINQAAITTGVQVKVTGYNYVEKDSEFSNADYMELEADKKLSCLLFNKKLGLFFNPIDFIQSEGGHLTYAQACSIPDDDDYKEPGLQYIFYTLARELKKMDEGILQSQGVSMIEF